MRAYTILKGKHNTPDKIRWINNIISYKPLQIHTTSNKEESKNYSGYELKKLKKHMNKNIILVRK